MEYLLVGKIVDTFSLDGSVKIISSSTNKEIRYSKGNILYIFIDNEYSPFKVEAYRKLSNYDVVRFDNINNIEQATLFKGKEIFAIKDIKDLNEGYYFYSDLVGCSIINEGKEIGTVIKVEEFPAQITLRAKTNKGKEFFVPFVKAFINNVDIKNKQIDINLVEGMLWR